MNKQSAKHSNGPHGSHPLFGEAGEASLAKLQRLAESHVKLGLQWGEEWARFATRRFDRDQEFLGSLASCRDWAAVSKLQASWLSEALADYLLEGHELADLVRRQTSEALAYAGSTGSQVKSEMGA
jgi:phasin protein